MTSSRGPITSRRWPWFTFTRPELGVPALVFALLLLHGATLGLTDDEAYYWVLSRHPALGYAFHPPMVAWVIAAARLPAALLPFLSRWLSPEGWVRLASCLCAAATLALSLDWLKGLGADAAGLRRGALVLLAFAGFFAFSWMMVPDLPLFLGWTIAFVASAPKGAPHLLDKRRSISLALGVTLATLSKFSGVLVAASAAWVVWRTQRGRERWLGLAAIALGLGVAAIPILIWNAQHEWAAILYQLRDRHEGASLSWLRYGKFWAAELVAAGPVLVASAFLFLGRAVTGRARGGDALIAAWIAPAAFVYCLQPLIADFKPHWAFIVWWPAALGLAARWALDAGSGRRAAIFHCAYGLGLVALITVACRYPLGARFGAEPLHDVTNDLYGWSEAPAYLAGLRARDPGLPRVIVGARYQTASQAAFAFQAVPELAVTLIPRDLKARDEWPELGVSDGAGPAWPRLTAPVLFVTDNRYDAAPEFAGARCEVAGRLEARRGGALAKWIAFWKCLPDAPANGRS